MEKELQLSAVSKWLKSYPGRYYLTNEQEELNSFLSQFHGYYMVQMGILDNYDFNSVNSFMNRVYVGRADREESELPIIESSFNDLPFQFESVDCFFLPHALAFCNEPEKLINEIYNILIPGGKLIIFGFNPFSFFGLTKLLKLAKNVPWCGKLYSMGHVKFLLHANGFSIDFQKFFCYRPPLKNEYSLAKLSFLEPFGKVWFPYAGSVYVLIAQKKMAPLSPVKKKLFTQKIPVTSGFPEPSTNKGL